MLYKKITFFLLSVCTVLSAVPKAIVFDFGGVMTETPNREAVINFLKDSFQLSEEEFEKLNQRKRQEIKSGKDDAEFWQEIAKERYVILPRDWMDKFDRIMKEAIGINSEMYAFVGCLKEQGIRVGLLSNIDQRLSKLIRKFGFYDPFDPCILSCEVGFEKPDPKAYEEMLKALQFSSNEVVFIDDKIENIETAQSLGFDTILFESPGQIFQELEKRGIL